MTRKLTLTAIFMFGFLAVGIVAANIGSSSILVTEAFAGEGW
jgi:hypothetical protein